MLTSHTAMLCSTGKAACTDRFVPPPQQAALLLTCWITRLSVAPVAILRLRPNGMRGWMLSAELGCMGAGRS